MRNKTMLIAMVAAGMLVGGTVPLVAQGGSGRGGGNDSSRTPVDPIKELVGRLNLAQYKATVAGLTQFGDRRQGTDRNRAAVDWIEAKLRSYGCSDIQRIHYMYNGRQLRNDSTNRVDSIARASGDTNAPPPPFVRRTGNRTFRGPFRPRNPVKGNVVRTGVNTNPMLQPDTALRRLDSQWDTPGEREEVYCTKVGTTHPDEMYLVSGHMDGHGFGAAANDDGSGTSIVLELARVLNSPDLQTDRSIRFALWNNEETGLNGSRAYVAQRKDLQGKEDPAGSGRYPEPKWLGIVQHDMMMFDHGMPDSNGKVSPVQRREADVNVEFAGTSLMSAESAKLAWYFRAANDKYATDYPVAVGNRMSNTDSDPFKDLAPTISVRENERLSQIGTGWDPQWHQPTDVISTYSDNDFRLGMNAAQTTLAAVAQLAGATLKP